MGIKGLFAAIGGRQQMGYAALVMGFGVLLSRLAGLLRDKVISYQFGATLESDIYFAAFVIPDFINYLLAGGYFSITLIPLLSGYFDKNETDGWRFFSSVVFWVAVCITLLTAAAMVLAPQLAVIAAPGLPAAAHARLAYFLRIIMPAQIFFLIGSCFTALLFLRKRFTVPALMPVVYNFMIILCGWLYRAHGMEGFCWGVLLGAFFGNLMIPVVAAWGTGGVRLQSRVFHEGLRPFIFMALPLMIGQSYVVLDEQLVRIFGSLAGIGAVSQLNYARRIMLVPIGVVAQAAGAASYPFLAELAERREDARFDRTLNQALTNTLVLLIPLSVWMMIAADPTITLVFQQGRFSPADQAATSLLLMILLTGVFCWGFQQILGRAFYARRDTLSPAVLGTLTTVLAVPMFYFLSRSWGAKGVAAAGVISIGFYLILLSLWWERRFGGEALAGLPKSMAMVAALSACAAVPAFFAGRWNPWSVGINPYLECLWQLALTGVVFGVVFLGLSVLLTPGLIRPFLEKAGGPGRLLLKRMGDGR